MSQMEKSAPWLVRRLATAALNQALWLSTTLTTGRLATGMSAKANSSFEEGTLIPHSRIRKEGKLNEELLAIILANSRSPVEVRGDILREPLVPVFAEIAIIDGRGGVAAGDDGHGRNGGVLPVAQQARDGFVEG